MNPIDLLLNGSCTGTRDRLSDQLEGELSGLRGLRVLRHLARCERCRAVLASLTNAVEQIRRLGRPQLSPQPSVAEAVVARIRHQRG